MSYETAGLTVGTLTPAYGRDYASADEAIKDYRAGKDFIFNSPSCGGYCSCRDFPGQRVTLRYSKKTRAVITSHKEAE